MYWHYGITPQVSMWPEPHVKLRARLVFSEDGITPIDNTKKMHRLRRSFTKSWHNARWRDMMLALLWNICDGQESLVIPFGEEKSTVLSVPTATFISPVSMAEAIEAVDEDDIDDPDETEYFLPDADDELETDVTEVDPAA